MLVIFFLHDGENPLKNETLLEHITGLFSSTLWCKASALEGKTTVPQTGPTVLLHPFHLQRLSLLVMDLAASALNEGKNYTCFFFRVFLSHCMYYCLLKFYIVGRVWGRAGGDGD